MKTIKAYILFVATFSTAIFAGCAGKNPIAEQTAEQTGAAYNNPQGTGATGAKFKPTPTRGFHSSGNVTSHVVQNPDGSIARNPDGTAILLHDYSWSQDIHSDYAGSGIKNASVYQGRVAKGKINGQDIWMPGEQGVTISELGETNIDGQAEAIEAVMAGQQARLAEIANILNIQYQGQALVVGQHYDGIVNVIDSAGTQAVRVGGVVAKALSPQYAIIEGGKELATQVVAVTTGDGETVAGYVELPD